MDWGKGPNVRVISGLFTTAEDLAFVVDRNTVTSNWQYVSETQATSIY